MIIFQTLFRRRIELPVIQRPSLPSLVNPFHPKPTVLVTADQTPAASDVRGLENDNYHQFVRQSDSVFSLAEDSSEASSSSSTPSPRDPTDQSSEEPEPSVRRLGPGGILDRLKSGVVSTRGFERF